MRQMTISRKFAVLYAVGRQMLRAAGCASRRTRPNIFTAAVIRAGTRLKRADFVRPAGISGFGRPVCAVSDGRATRIGMYVEILPV